MERQRDDSNSKGERRGKELDFSAFYLIFRHSILLFCNETLKINSDSLFGHVFFFSFVNIHSKSNSTKFPE